MIKEKICKIITNRKRKKYSFISSDSGNYERWITRIESEYNKIDIDNLAYQPKISVLVPVYNVLDKHFVPCIESVINQDYPNWELCLADDCSTWDNVKKTLAKYEGHEKIKIVYREKNGNISASTNSALALATGEFVAFLDCDDVLATNALSEVVSLLNHDRELDFIYSDEDKIDDDGNNRRMPHFKPDWSPDTFMSLMYTSHFSVYRKSIADEIGGLREGYEGAQDYDFTLRFTEKTSKIGHIPKVLYHWREREESTAASAGAKPYVLEAARKSKEEALIRRGLKGEVCLMEGEYQYRVDYFCEDNPKVSVIIPSKDNYDILKQCVKTFVELTKYKNYEIIIVDNGSNDENKEKYQRLAQEYKAQYVYEKKDFNFSYMCNLGAKHSTGELLLFLNDDIEIINDYWLDRMVGQAMLPYAGVVGAKLLYPDNESIQHAGVVIIKDGPVHSFGRMKDTDSYYFGRNRHNYNQLAVTGACLMLKRSIFEEIECFYEGLPVAYNDIDLCFKVYKKGYYNVIRNDAVLLHHESISRGYDFEDKKKFERLMKEKDKLFSRHPEFDNSDPFYNPNLADDRVDFACGFTDRDIDYNKVNRSGIPHKDSSGVIYNVESVKEECDSVYIKGWIVSRKLAVFSDFKPVHVILRGDSGQIYKCETNRVKRDDVDKHLQGNGRFEYSGFTCRVSKEDLNDESFVIGLEIGDKFVMTNGHIMTKKC